MPVQLNRSNQIPRPEHEYDELTDSEDEVNYNVLPGPMTPDPDETIRDVSLNKVIETMYYSISPLYAELGNLVLGIRGPETTTMIIRKIQIIRELLLSLQYVANARQNPIRFETSQARARDGRPTQ